MVGATSDSDYNSQSSHHNTANIPQCDPTVLNSYVIIDCHLTVSESDSDTLLRTEQSHASSQPSIKQPSLVEDDQNDILLSAEQSRIGHRSIDHEKIPSAEEISCQGDSSSDDSFAGLPTARWLCQ